MVSSVRTFLESLSTTQDVPLLLSVLNLNSVSAVCQNTWHLSSSAHSLLQNCLKKNWHTTFVVQDVSSTKEYQKYGQFSKTLSKTNTYSLTVHQPFTVSVFRPSSRSLLKETLFNSIHSCALHLTQTSTETRWRCTYLFLLKHKSKHAKSWPLRRIFSNQETESLLLLQSFSTFFLEPTG